MIWAPEDILIVAIDEASLNKIGHWPWPHSLHAALLNKLAAEHPRVIGFDMLLSGQEHGDEDVNQALSSAIGQAKNVVMPMRLEVPHIGASAKQRMPAPSLASQVAGVGRDHAPLDYDGVVRSIYLWEGVAAGGLSAVGLPHFARSVLQVANQLPSSYRVVNSELKVPKSALKGGSHVIERLVSYERRRVGFLGPPGHFQSISYAKVLSGDYPNSYFKDRIVLVGITAAGLGDAYITPLSSASQPMPGVELNANVIASMRSQQLVSESPLWFTCLICILLAVLPLFWLHKLPPRKSLLANTGYFFVVLSLAIILM